MCAMHADNCIMYRTKDEFMSLGMDESSAYRNIRKGRAINMGPKGVEWMPIPGLPGYEACRSGLIRCVISRRGSHLGVLKATKHHKGYARHGISSQDGRRVTKLAHYLVAQTFLGDPKPGQVVNHKNGIKGDNRADNLEWATLAENTSLAWRTGLCTPAKGESNGSAKLTSAIAMEIRESNASSASLAARFGVSKVQVNKIKRKEAWAY